MEVKEPQSRGDQNAYGFSNCGLILELLFNTFLFIEHRIAVDARYAVHMDATSTGRGANGRLITALVTERLAYTSGPGVHGVPSHGREVPNTMDIP